MCCGVGSFPPQVEGQPLSSIPRLMETMQAAGAGYVEFGVGSVMQGDEAQFEELRAALESQPLKVEAFNGFIPAQHRITGPHVDLQSVLDYCRTALQRCRALGGAVVVLGSGGARRVPEGFNMGVAEGQFIEFCRALGPIADEAGIDIAIEPLNSREDNLIVSVADGAQIVDEVGHPRIQLLADFYHMFEEHEPVENVAEAGSRLRHTHVADLGRVAPGYAPEGEADFVAFFRNLRRAGYDRRGHDARCSFEGRLDDIAAQSKPLLDLLKQRWQESAA